MRDKIALGSVQFGMDYGISNQSGEVPADEVLKIVTLARDNQISLIDTAKAYGSAEDKLGKVGIEDFDVVSKIVVSNNVVEDVKESIEKMGLNKLHALLMHDFNVFQADQKYYEEFQKCKKLGLVKKVGFSLNFQHELKFLLKNKIQFDFLQLPFNLLDQRFSDQFELLNDMGIEIHARSIFLQGLFFMKPALIDPYLDKIKPTLSLLDEICRQEDISKSSLALNFVLLNPYISKVVLGVTSEKQLQENLLVVDEIEKVRELLPVLNEINCESEQLIVPLNWEF